MKYMRTVAVVAVLGLATGGYAIVQNHRGASLHGMDSASMVGHLSEAFGKVAAFDRNKDGKLDTGEKQALAKAIEDGSLTLPAPTPAKDMFSSEEQRLNHFAEMYARFAAFDANHDGELDSTEQNALRAAIENGELSFLIENDPRGGHQHVLEKSLHPR